MLNLKLARVLNYCDGGGLCLEKVGGEKGLRGNGLFGAAVLVLRSPYSIGTLLYLSRSKSDVLFSSILYLL
jgi:hypothetical protein